MPTNATITAGRIQVGFPMVRLAKGIGITVFSFHRSVVNKMVSKNWFEIAANRNQGTDVSLRMLRFILNRCCIILL